MTTASLISAAMLLVVAGCRGGDYTGTERVAYVTVEVVRPSEISRVSYAGARVEGRDETLVFAMGPGKIEEILVSQGDSVTAGQRLVRLNTDQQAGTGVSGASAAVNAAVADLENAEKNHLRLLSLYESGGVSLQQVEAAEALLEAARARLAGARAGYSQAVTARDNSWVTAPFSGRVGRIWAREGNHVANSPLLSISDDSVMVARILLPERDILHLETGLPAYMTVGSLGGESFPGVVISASSTVDPVSGLVPVEVRFTGTRGRLRPGMTGRVVVLMETAGNTAVVPESALRRTRSGNQVVVVEDGTAVVRDVKLGIYNEGMVQVVEGLSFGDSLVTSGHSLLQDGTPVEVVER